MDASNWRFCPEGYMCNNGTNLASMNLNACPPGKFCIPGMQSIDEAMGCPAGRLCDKATAVDSLAQISTCGIDDPTYCYIGDVCLPGFFCRIGAGNYTENSCGELNSFAGARERFFCSRSSQGKINI